MLSLAAAPALRAQIRFETGPVSESPKAEEKKAPAAEKTVPVGEKKKSPASGSSAVSSTRKTQTEEDRKKPLSSRFNKLEREGGETSKPGEEPQDESITSSFITQTEARTFTLSVPAPRGQILDRRGFPMAQNRIAYYAAINFPLLDEADQTAILRYAGERIVHVNGLLNKRWDLSAKIVLKHYHNRRWLPLVFSGPLTDEEIDKVRADPFKGLMLHPIYLRHYPHGAFLSHVLGYVGKRPPRNLGEIEVNEPLWGDAVGVEGLEQTFNTWLTGEPGRINMLFDADGTKLNQEMVRRPRPGNNIVTSIDAEMQKLAEEVLAEKVKRGAFVVMDVRTGDVLVLASYPQFDPNLFIPAISQENYSKLSNDPAKPLYPRAFRGAYPPASTFKVAVALAALEEQVVTESTVYSCPTSWSIGDVVMHNWNKKPEGYMNVIGALMRSCNTWFYQVGTRTGSDPVTMMARRLGLGEKTGLPLNAEAEGLVPTDRWWREKYKYRMSKGDLANICIGQGQIETSPIQVARQMAAIGNRQYVVKPRLVKQIQDYNNAVIQSFPVEERSRLDIDPYYLSVVRQGMKDVVNAGRGTGHAAGNDDIDVAGKTGTGQWKPAYEQNIGWFAGFAPADAPVFSFAVIYEGDPGEKVGGGKNAAPVVGEFLKRYLEDETHLAEIKEASDEMKTLLARIEPPSVGRPAIESIFRNGAAADEDPVAAAPPPVASKRPESGISRWFRKLRRN